MLASALLAGTSCQKESSEAEVAESVETVFAVQIPSEPMTKYVFVGLTIAVCVLGILFGGIG